MSYELKELVFDEGFVEKINIAFADLRADYELELDESKEQIEKLKAVHIDIGNNLSNLVSYSIVSSGKISGLRGTGKTHLFLMARNQINNEIFDKKVFAVYLNVKRVHLPKECDQEIFNRVFSMYLYDEVAKQLGLLFRDIYGNNAKDKILSLFKKDERKLCSSIKKALQQVALFQAIIKSGSKEYLNLDKGQISSEDMFRELVEQSVKIIASVNPNEAKISVEDIPCASHHAASVNPLCLHSVTSSIQSSKERLGARLSLIMKPPNVVNFYFLSKKWSENLSSIIMS